MVAEQLEAFLARQEERELAVPVFVEEVFRSFHGSGKEFETSRQSPEHGAIIRAQSLLKR